MTDDRATQIQQVERIQAAIEASYNKPDYATTLNMAKSLYAAGARIPDPPAPPAPEPEPWVVNEEAENAYWKSSTRTKGLRAALPHLIAANRRRIVREIVLRLPRNESGFIVTPRQSCWTLDELVAALVPDEKETKGGGV